MNVSILHLKRIRHCQTSLIPTLCLLFNKTFAFVFQRNPHQINTMRRPQQKKSLDVSVASRSQHKQGYYRTVTVLRTMSSDKVRTQHCSWRSFLLPFLQYCFIFSFTIWATNCGELYIALDTPKLATSGLICSAAVGSTSCSRACIVQPLLKGFLVLLRLKVIRVVMVLV